MFVHLVFALISVESIDFPLLFVVLSFDFFELADKELLVVDKSFYIDFVDTN